MHRYALGCLIAIVLTGTLAAGQPPWTIDLAYPGGGYWPVRLTVAVENPAGDDVMGAPVGVVVGEADGEANLVGLPAESIRVTDSAGQELLYEITGADGLPRHKGALAAGDIITLPVEVPTGEAATSFVYAGNAQAWAPPDYFGGQFVNGGFEQGNGAPAGWQTWGVDDQHRMAWQEGAARTGERGVRCDVDAGAEPTWVKYMQERIPVTPGTKYRFTAWVRGENVVGTAGWYIHVDGSQPQMVNMSEGGDGTFGWRQVTIEFEVPEGGQLFSCGTILRGSGTAWYDDAAFESTGGTALRVAVAKPERLELRRVAAPDRSAGREWRWQTPVVIRNFGDTARESVLVSVNMHRPRTLLAKHNGWRYDLPVRIIDPGAPDKPISCVWADAKLLTVTSLPPRSEKELAVYWSASAKPSGASETLQLVDWTNSDLNLARNGDMEEAEGGTAAAWPSGEEGREGEKRFTVRRVEGGVSGEWCLELSVPAENADVGWVGSRQKVPVQPNTRYLLAGYIRSKDFSGNARIHGHFLQADGSLSELGPFFGTSPQISDTTDWTFTSISVTTPPDCAFIDIHLTMNATGTLWHDGILLVQTQTALVGDIEGGPGAGDKLSVWRVNPMVKVFPDDWPDADGGPGELYACRNEREPFKLAMRSTRGGEVAVRASALRGPDGAALEPPTAFSVGYVPVDFPVGYARSDQPQYFRMKPTSPGNDGWAGEWPDPLIPLTDGSIELQANRTQALWFDIHVPPDATPGEYSGQVEIEFAGDTQRFPVRLTVWPYTLPDRKACKAIYDLRNGRGWNIFAGDDQWTMIEAWYRLLADYNVSPGIIHPTAQFTQEDGRLAIDLAEFDRACEMLFDELNCNIAYTPWFFYSFGWAYSPKSYFGFEPFTPEWNEIFQGGLRQFFDHVTQRGWRDYFVYYVSDEPDRNSEEVHTNLARVCDAAREAVPGVLVYSSTWTHLPRLDGHLNLWGIGPHGSFPIEEVEQRRAAGDRFWFTTDGQMCLDTPYLAIERLLPWFCLKYGVEAYEFWGVSWWTYDPWEYGWHSYIRQSHEGENYYWVRYPNGDGYLTYPGERVGRKEPLPSIRLAAAREGIEDYELLLELQKHAERDGAARRALDRVKKLVEMPNPGGRYSTAIMPNPDAVTEARIAAGKALAKAMK